MSSWRSRYGAAPESCRADRKLLTSDGGAPDATESASKLSSASGGSFLGDAAGECVGEWARSRPELPDEGRPGTRSR